MSFLKKLFGIKSVDYNALIKKGAIIVDVRTPMEYKYGKIEKSKNIPLDSLSSKIKKMKQRNQVVIFCCASGARSGQACRMAKQKGIDAYNGGGWRGLKRRIN